MLSRNRSISLFICVALSLTFLGLANAQKAEAAPPTWSTSWFKFVTNHGNTTVPQVSITSPAGNTTFTSAQTVNIVATASDDVGVTKVEFYDGSTLRGTDTSAPYSYSWVVSSSANGTHNFTAKAYDAAGNSSTSSPDTLVVNIAATVSLPPTDTTAPTVSISNPAANTNYTSAQTVTVAASALDNVGVTKVEFYDGSTLKGTDTSAPYSYSWAVSSSANGTHNFTAKAYDAAGNSATSGALALTVNISTQSATSQGTAPVLDYVQPSGSDFSLGWSQPVSAFGSPAGGYDIIIDGVDTNSTYETFQQTSLISGLTAEQHCFQIEARWTQASPAQYLRSNQVCAVSESSTSSTSSSSGSSTPTSLGSLYVFPGAQGFGRNTVAGRGGQVIKVTNLNDSGPGSFRQAAQYTSGPRIIVFEVGGVIKLSSVLTIDSPYITIAGQTAPDPGVTFEGYGLRITTHDLLMQHVFVRHTVSDDTDAIDVHHNGSSTPYNIVIDHCSVSWGGDETLSFSPGSTNTTKNNVTYSNLIIAEGTGSHYGTLISDGTKNFSAIGNLWMSNIERQPRVKGGVVANIVNNVSYNVGTADHTVIGPTSGTDTGPVYLSSVGNVYIDGPSTPSGAYALAANSDTNSGSQIYVSDDIANNVFTSRTGTYIVGAPPVSLDAISILPSNQVEDSVLANAGARSGERDGILGNGVGDPVDERLVNEVKTGRGSIKSSPPDAPNFQATYRAFTVPANPSGDDNGNGYTNVEEVLYQMALQVEGKK
jgi:hypothetical protein